MHSRFCLKHSTHCFPFNKELEQEYDYDKEYEGNGTRKFVVVVASSKFCFSCKQQNELLLWKTEFCEADTALLVNNNIDELVILIWQENKILLREIFPILRFMYDIFVRFYCLFFFHFAYEIRKSFDWWRLRTTIFLRQKYVLRTPNQIRSLC